MNLGGLIIWELKGDIKQSTNSTSVYNQYSLIKTITDNLTNGVPS